MKPFHTPAWRKRHTAEKFRKKSRVVSGAVASMEKVMKKAIGAIISNYEKTGRFAAPDLSGMDDVTLKFYKSTITQAYYSAKDEKEAQTSLVRRMAMRLPIGLPRKLTKLEEVFRDKRYWPKVMKRSEKLTERLRKAYLQKLDRKFRELLPRLQSGEMTVEEAKQKMMERWHASKARVNNIFQTESTRYFAKTQLAYFEGDDEIIGFMFDAMKHKTRTKWCDDRHGLIYRPGTALLRKNTPPCHWHCYSNLIALANTAYNRKLLEDPSRDPAKVRVTPLPPGWNS